MLTDQQLADLRKAAEAARPYSSPPWHPVDPDSGSEFVSDSRHMAICRVNLPVVDGPGKTVQAQYSVRNAVRRFIAAADPSTILALLDDLAAAKARLAEVTSEEGGGKEAPP